MAECRLRRRDREGSVGRELGSHAERPALAERFDNGPKLQFGLSELALGIRPSNNACTGICGDACAVDLGTAQSDSPLAVAMRVDPTDRAGVTPTVESLELTDDANCF